MTNKSFEEVYSRIFDPEIVFVKELEVNIKAGDSVEDSVSPKLKPLLKKFYKELNNRPVNLITLKESIMKLLSFLTTTEGRTDVNCIVVDVFINIENSWERDWSYLPDSFQLVIEDIGGGLHDTFYDPPIAKRLDSTPEQLLERVKELRV